MLSKYLRELLTAYTLKTGRLVSLYRRLCKPDGVAWTRYIKRHNSLNQIGEDCQIQMNVVITDPPYVRIGNNVHLTGCILFGHDGSINMLKQAYGVNVDRVGKIDIRDNVFVGHQAIIMPDVTIGPDAIVAAGAVVTRDVPPGSIVGGAPAKVIGQVSDYVDRLQAEMQQLPWRDHPCMQAGYVGPSNPELDRLRVQHFFGDADSKKV
jgi:acetyltransferase-like isoleucine patch superfamily enzyme